ncbi:Uncharacterised protein [Chlamydia trachomatis]|nr:Uncharacterised protein [Chlamydia trachomatis]
MVNGMNGLAGFGSRFISSKSHGFSWNSKRLLGLSNFPLARGCFPHRVAYLASGLDECSSRVNKGVSYPLGVLDTWLRVRDDVVFCSWL